MSAPADPLTEYTRPEDAQLSESERAHLAIRRATDYATESCGLLESVIVLISQRDNARAIAEAYQKRLGEDLESVRERIAERASLMDAERKAAELRQSLDSTEKTADRLMRESEERSAVLAAFIAAFDRMAFADRWPLEDIAARARAMMENTTQNQSG